MTVSFGGYIATERNEKKIPEFSNLYVVRITFFGGKFQMAQSEELVFPDLVELTFLLSSIDGKFSRYRIRI